MCVCVIIFITTVFVIENERRLKIDSDIGGEAMSKQQQKNKSIERFVINSQKERERERKNNKVIFGST